MHLESTILLPRHSQSKSLNKTQNWHNLLGPCALLRTAHGLAFGGLKRGLPLLILTLGPNVGVISNPHIDQMFNILFPESGPERQKQKPNPAARELQTELNYCSTSSVSKNNVLYTVYLKTCKALQETCQPALLGCYVAHNSDLLKARRLTTCCNLGTVAMRVTIFRSEMRKSLPTRSQPARVQRQLRKKAECP